MNKSTPEPSVSDTETSGSKNETKHESNSGRESEQESDVKKVMARKLMKKVLLK